MTTEELAKLPITDPRHTADSIQQRIRDCFNQRDGEADTVLRMLRDLAGRGLSDKTVSDLCAELEALVGKTPGDMLGNNGVGRANNRASEKLANELLILLAHDRNDADRSDPSYPSAPCDESYNPGDWRANTTIQVTPAELERCAKWAEAHEQYHYADQLRHVGWFLGNRYADVSPAEDR